MPLPSRTRLLPAAVMFLVAGWVGSASSEAGVIVLANRTDAHVDFATVPADGKAIPYRLKARDIVPIPAGSEVKIVFRANGATRQELLEANSIYYFVLRDEQLQLGKVALGPLAADVDPPAPPRPGTPGAANASVYTVPVMLLADEDEPAVRRLWEKRLRDRLAEASKIIEQHCRVRFEVVAVGTWNSDNRIIDFAKSLREFELEVNPAPARLAVGFTSQYKRPPRQRIHLGGTRGPLHSHILVREWAQHVTKTERLEVLLHELGHFVGAVHSAEGNSVMRPVLGDHRSHARDFRIGFDPVNTFVMYLLGEELRAGRHRGFGRLHPYAKAQLRSAYTAMAKMMPEDESANHYLQLLDQSPLVRPTPTRHPKPLVEGTQAVVQAITDAARRNNSLPTGPSGSANTPSRLSGDRLTEHYVRRAAARAARLPSDVAAKAFLLGLGIALDNSVALRYTPIAGEFYRQVESSRQRYQRLTVLGSPTMRGRPDLAKHFVASSGLTALIGRQAAESAGVGKELIDSRLSSGFSFVDLSANLAGTTFATHVRDAKISLDTLASSFQVEDFLPEAGNLKEGISWQEFLQQYHSAQDDRFLGQQAAIRQRILALPGYRKR